MAKLRCPLDQGVTRVEGTETAVSGPNSALRKDSTACSHSVKGFQLHTVWDATSPAPLLNEIGLRTFRQHAHPFCAIFLLSTPFVVAS